MSGWRVDLDQRFANSAARMMGGILSLSCVVASEARGLVLHSCPVLRREVHGGYCRGIGSKQGAKDVGIQIARACIKPQLTALQGHVADKTDQ
jgi:hypothetical protein